MPRAHSASQWLTPQTLEIVERSFWESHPLGLLNPKLSRDISAYWHQLQNPNCIRSETKCHTRAKTSHESFEDQKPVHAKDFGAQLLQVENILIIWTKQTISMQKHQQHGRCRSQVGVIYISSKHCVNMNKAWCGA